jgi:alpha-N-arabinofuranosidase
VAQEHPQADDANAGTESFPFRMIGAAAKAAQPGDRVLVHQGVYREWVRPARGGSGPDAMISCEAAEGESVAIKGTEVVEPAK